MAHPVTVLVFGTFDGIHDGHRFFLSQARALGDRLVVVIARDATAKILKHKTPRLNERKRVETVKNLSISDDVRLGDAKLGSYRIIKIVKPDIVAIGHDQADLEQNLKSWRREQNLDFSIQKIKRYDSIKLA